MQGKIAIEEHFALSASITSRTFKEDYLAQVLRLMGSMDDRLAAMDASGVELALLSLQAPGVEGEIDTAKAIDFARRANDHLVEHFLARHPTRFAGLASVALQDPEAAAAELTRAVKDLGLKGVMVNGYTNIGDVEHGRYLDDPACAPFWAAAEELQVPVFLHPRPPLPSQRLTLQGYDALVGASWGFLRETAEHAIRIILSGLLDRFPRTNIILGHLGEGLIFALPRMESRLRHERDGTHGAHRKPVMDYFRENFYVATSGIFETNALQYAISQIGAERVLFAIDYPFEDSAELGAWFDGADISESDRAMIGHENARKLLRL
jgi:2,3-dihydroxybenzoate decarboxylase